MGYETIQYEENFQYKAYIKNPGKYGDKLIAVYGLRVVQISESNYWDADHTFVIAVDGSYNVYWINLYGYWDNIYEGSYIQLTALPLAYFSYPNTQGDRVNAIVCAGVKLK